MKIFLVGSFLFASVFTITAMAFTNTFLPVVFSEVSLPGATFEKVWKNNIQQYAATTFFIAQDYALKIRYR